MEQIHIKEYKTKINVIEMLNIVSNNKKVEIDIDGEIYIDRSCNSNKVLVFRYDNTLETSNILDIKTIIKNIFKDYKPEINGDTCTLNLLNAWQKIIFLNQDRMLYFDHQTDGVELFEDSILEQMGWNCIPCEVNYREIASFIEANCNGTLVYYDNEIQFNGFVLVDDIDDVRTKVKNFLIKRIKENIENDLIDVNDDEVMESLAFFGLKV